jgi:choline dehydrogenase-like flavoprotein
MFVDALIVPDGSQVEADVCIVGAGAAGITIARELGTASSLRTVVLESGRFAADPATQSLYAGRIEGRRYFPLDSARTRQFGGTTNEWGGECRPLDALDFERRDWVPESGWPFGLATLLPFYERAQSICQLGRFAYTAADWDRQGVRPIGVDGERIRTYAFHYSPPTRFGDLYRNDLARATNIVVYLGANAVDLDTATPPVQLRAVRVASLSGSRFRVKARLFILAAGGIENARLLLLANSVEHAGLGNSRDQVGRYFMEHLYLDRAATILAQKGNISDFYTSGHWHEGRRVRGILGLSPELQRREQLTNYCAVLDEEPPGWGGRWRLVLSALGREAVPARAPNRLRALVNRAARISIAGRAPSVRRYLVKNVMEQAPNPESRIVLGSDRDQLGCARVVLRWRLSAIDKRTAHRAHQILEEDLGRAAVGRLRSALGKESDPWPSTLRGARHHIGTTRMHTDAHRGVVDADCRVHGIANLYIAGSSVFPTSGSANPTLTIVALALRLAAHVRHRLDGGSSFCLT